MTNKKFLKAFVSGLAFPAVFLPLAYTFIFFSEGRALPTPLQFIPMYIPIVFGIANMLYVRMSEGVPAANVNVGLWVAGAILGFVVAVVGVFILHVPTLIFVHLRPGLEYVPLIALPIVYGLIFRYIVKWLNKAIGV